MCSTVSQDPVHPVLELARDSFGTCSGVRILCWLVSHYAHLDVRLANICFKKDGTAMLIDLDRSRRRHNTCEGLYMLYGESVMYKAPKHWTVDKLDWRQLGLMIWRDTSMLLRTTPTNQVSAQGTFSHFCRKGRTGSLC